MDINRKENKSTGNRGEELAAEFLVGLGYKILERNLRLLVGEIDILAQSGRTIVLVEVKTVRGGGFGLAQELVRFKKQQKLKLLARALYERYPKSTIRIDVIGVDLSVPSEPKFEHLVNAVN